MRVFDVNLRKPFYDAQVLADSMDRATLIKLNEIEMPGCDVAAWSRRELRIGRCLTSSWLAVAAGSLSSAAGLRDDGVARELAGDARWRIIVTAEFQRRLRIL